MRRLLVITRHLTSPRGLLVAFAAVTGVAGIVVGSQPARTILLILSTLALTGALLLISLRLSEVHTRTGRLEREQAHDAEVRSDAVPTAAQPVAAAASQALAPAVSTGSPVVTVVIPSYNEETHGREAIESLQAQNFADWECIVVDDASTDGSLRAMSEAAKGDARIRLIRHRVNGGLSASRNTGLRLARGRFVTFLDADDVLLPTSLEDRLHAVLPRLDDPHVLGSYTGVTYRQGAVPLRDLPRSILWPNEERKVVDFVIAGGECPFPVMSPLCLTELLRELGGFDESMTKGAEDWDLWQRALRNGYVFVPGTAKTAVYRQRPDSMVRQRSSPHARLGISLIERSHGDADPALMVAPSPTPLPRPLGWYTKALTQSKRAIRFAALARASGDQADADDLMSSVRDLPVGLVERHVDIEDQVRRGLTRAGEAASEEQIRDTVEWARSRFSAPSLVDDDAVAPNHVSVLLVPQHAEHLTAMLEHVSEFFPGTDFEVLLVEREGGAQGVIGKLPPGVPARSLNQWVLGRHVAEVALIGLVRSAVVEEIALELERFGTRLIEVPDGYAELKAIPDAPPRSAGRSRPQHPIPSSNRSGQSVVERWVAEEDALSRVDFDQIRDLKDIHRGERVVLIGNGPSLNQLDLTLLKAERTFGVNGIFYAADQMGFSPTYYVVEDSAVVDDNLDAIRSYDAENKLFPSVYREKIGEIAGASFFMMNRSFYAPDSPNFCVPNFATDCTQQVFCGQSVTILNLQLAYHMGFTEVILIGMDFSYTIPDDAKQTGYQILSAGPDPNHFHPDYFGKGKVWKQPKLDRVLACYALAKQLYEADGRRIVNSTFGGQLHLFDRIPYEKALR